MIRSIKREETEVAGQVRTDGGTDLVEVRDILSEARSHAPRWLALWRLVVIGQSRRNRPTGGHERGVGSR